MFRRALISSSFLFLAICAIAYFDHAHLRRCDYLSDRSFKLDQKPPQTRHILASHPTAQDRTGVQKDLWIPKSGRRLHTRLKSAASHLVISEKNSKIDATEALSEVEYASQESPRLLRAAIAKEGVYSYPANTFRAFDADIYLIEAASSSLPDAIDPSSAHFSGHAAQIDAALSQKTPSFEAKEISAICKFHAKDNP